MLLRLNPVFAMAARRNVARLNFVTVRHFSMQFGDMDDKAQKTYLISNMHRYQSEIKSVLSKMERAISLIKKGNPEDPRLDRFN